MGSRLAGLSKEEVESCTGGLSPPGTPRTESRVFDFDVLETLEDSEAVEAGVLWDWSDDGAAASSRLELLPGGRVKGAPVNSSWELLESFPGLVCVRIQGVEHRLRLEAPGARAVLELPALTPAPRMTRREPSHLEGSVWRCAGDGATTDDVAELLADGRLRFSSGSTAAWQLHPAEPDRVDVLVGKCWCRLRLQEGGASAVMEQPLLWPQPRALRKAEPSCSSTAPAPDDAAATADAIAAARAAATDAAAPPWRGAVSEPEGVAAPGAAPAPEGGGGGAAAADVGDVEGHRDDSAVAAAAVGPSAGPPADERPAAVADPASSSSPPPASCPASPRAVSSGAEAASPEAAAAPPPEAAADPPASAAGSPAAAARAAAGHAAEAPAAAEGPAAAASGAADPPVAAPAPAALAAAAPRLAEGAPAVAAPAAAALGAAPPAADPPTAAPPTEPMPAADPPTAAPLTEPAPAAVAPAAAPPAPVEAAPAAAVPTPAAVALAAAPPAAAAAALHAAAPRAESPQVEAPPAAAPPATAVVAPAAERSRHGAVAAAAETAQQAPAADVPATGPGRPKRCVVVHRKTVAIRQEPRRLGKLIGFLKSGATVDMLEFQGGWGRHEFTNDSGEVCLGWSQMFSKDAEDFIAPVGSGAPPPLPPPPAKREPPAAERQAPEALQRPAKPGLDEKMASNLKYGLSLVGLDADEVLEEVSHHAQRQANAERDAVLDQAQHGYSFWKATPIRPEDVTSPLVLVVVTKPFLPIRKLPTPASPFLGALSCGREFELLEIDDTGVQPWGRLDYCDHKKQTVTGWVALYDGSHGDLAVPPSARRDDPQESDQMELVHLRAIRDVATRASLGMAFRAEERMAALRAMPRYSPMRRIARAWDEDLFQLQARLLVAPLGAVGLPPRAGLQGRFRQFSRVCVMGAHHCCTNALGRELGRYFDVEVLNGEYGDDFGKEKRSPIWKHRVFTRPPSLPEGTLCVCLVKDPAFWLQSMGRKAPTSFYHVRALARHPGTGDLTDAYASKEELNDAKPDDILKAVEFDGVVYKDALQVWEATVESYFDEDVFPPDTTAILRCEDFLFRFDEVIRQLALLGLDPKVQAERPTSPLDAPAKGHMNVRSRDRQEALSFYGDEGNRHAGLSEKAMHRLMMMSSASTLVDALGYGGAGCISWVP